MEIKNICAREEVLYEELSNINVQLTALGQKLIDLGRHLKENPARINLLNCDINNENNQCTLSMDFKELQEYPALVQKLLSSYHQLKNELKAIKSQAEETCSEE